MHELGVLHNDIRPEKHLDIFKRTHSYGILYRFQKSHISKRQDVATNFSDFQKKHLAPKVCQYMSSSPVIDIYSLGKILEEIVKHFCDCLRSLSYHMCRDDPNDRLT